MMIGTKQVQVHISSTVVSAVRAHGRSSRGYTIAVAPSISMTSTSVPAGITWSSSSARADHTSPESLTSPCVPVTSSITTAFFPTSA